jgi:hypothetical protein
MKAKITTVRIPELEEAPMRYRFWAEHEIEILKEYYGRSDVRKIAEYLDRTISGVQNKAHSLGLRRRKE